jgi:hypothetical protein
MPRCSARSARLDLDLDARPEQLLEPRLVAADEHVLDLLVGEPLELGDDALACLGRDFLGGLGLLLECRI